MWGSPLGGGCFVLWTGLVFARVGVYTRVVARGVCIASVSVVERYRVRECGSSVHGVTSASSALAVIYLYRAYLYRASVSVSAYRLALGCWRYFEWLMLRVFWVVFCCLRHADGCVCFQGFEHIYLTVSYYRCIVKLSASQRGWRNSQGAYEI